MAQPPENPKSPNKKPSNSGIFAAWKNLTGSKRYTIASSSPTAPAVEDADALDSSQDLSSSSAANTDHSKKSWSVAAATPSPINGHEAQRARNAAGIEVPSDLVKLAQSLGRDHILSDRLHAARQISQYLNEYPAMNVSGIWQRGKDLVHLQDEPEAFDAAYALLLACARHPSLDTVEKPILFDTLAHKAMLAHPPRCLDVLNAITKGAKDLDGLVAAKLASFLVDLLDRSYELADSARKKSKTEKSQIEKSQTEKSSTATQISPEDANLADVFQFLLNATKFSSFKSFDDSHLDLIIDNVFAICKKTRAESDLSHALEILEALLVYSVFPQSSLRFCIEVLCSIISSVDSLRSQTLDLITQKLLNSYLGANALSILQDILQETPSKPSKDRNAVRGAVQTLRQVVSSSNHDFPAAQNFPALFSALDESLKLQSVRLEIDILALLLEVFQKPEMVHQILLDENAWIELSKVMVHLYSGVHAQEAIPTVAPDKAGSTEKETFPAPKFTDGFQTMATHLLALGESPDIDRKTSVVQLLLQVVRYLSDSQAMTLVDSYVAERLIFPTQEQWLTHCLELQKAIVRDNRRSPVVRLHTLEAIREAHSVAAASTFSEAQELAIAVLETLGDPADPTIVDFLADFAVDVAVGTSNLDNFNAIVKLLQSLLSVPYQDIQSPSRSSSTHEKLGSPAIDTVLQYANTPAAVIVKSLVTMFLRSINRSAEKTQELFNMLLAIARSPDPAPEARIIALKVLSRLRADVNHALYVVADTESEGIAAALCRTADTAMSPEVSERLPAQPPKRESSTKRKSQAASSSAPVVARQSTNAGGRMTKPTPPLWMYPGPKGLPEDPPSESSHLLSSSGRSSEEAESVKPVVLKLGHWLELVLDILQREELEWETYSYLIVHLGPQLGNHSLFVDAIPQIKLLRNVLCDLLQNKKFHEPPAFTNLKKSDVANCLYHVQTILISYHHHFAKSEEDEMVKSFVFGIAPWERTSEVCIHALSVCCHETPMSLVKYLSQALSNMISIIAQSTVAVHILEFLAGLARLPTLFRNFREDEFKSVFGICFRYLQYVRDQRAKLAQQTATQATKSANTSRAQRESDSDIKTPALGEVLPQYVYFMTYHVMVFWFIALRLPDRERHLAWIRSNLLYENENGQLEMEEQSQSTIDLMHRVAYSDRDETLPNPNFAKPADGPVLSKNYLVGLSILTVDIGTWTGVSHITIRRPSGTKYAVSRPQVTHLPRHQVPIYPIASDEAEYPADYVGVTPDDIVQSLYSPLSVSPELVSLTDGPVELPDDDVTKRAITMFDRISALDCHKVGIIYIGEKQTSESEILANVMGSADYIDFLNGIGTLTELKGANFNTQGLDREYGTDGKFTYCWRDRVSELVFHVTTMMPTDLERDPQCSLKKRHIGNDHVNIIFNNSGLPFEYETFPSDFNFVNIVINPEARSSFIDTRLRAARRRKNQQLQHHHQSITSETLTETENLPPSSSWQVEEPDDDSFYKITVLTKPGLPKISPASESKVVSGKSLSSFVRLLALNASVFAPVWANRAGGEHVSSWRSRLREIERLRQRLVSTLEKNSRAAENNQPSNAISNNNNNSIGNSSTTSPQPQASTGGDRVVARESGLHRRASAATFLSEANTANRTSGLGNNADSDGRTSSGSHE